MCVSGCRAIAQRHQADGVGLIPHVIPATLYMHSAAHKYATIRINILCAKKITPKMVVIVSIDLLQLKRCLVDL